MSNLNKVLLMGRLTKDPELRYTPQGVPVSEVGIAINREYSTTSGDRRKETTFVDVTLWRRHAELVCQYLNKGSPIFIEGRLQLDSWETPEGHRRSRLRVVADGFQFVGRADRGDADSGSGGRGPAPREVEYHRGHEGAAGRDEHAGAPAQAWPESEDGGHDGSSPDESEIPF